MPSCRLTKILPASMLAGLLSLSGAPQNELELTLENIARQNYGVRSASVSPDGKWVAASARTATQSGIFLISVEERRTEPRYLGPGSSPAWAPDSLHLLVSRSRDLWVLDVDGTAVRQVTNDGDSERNAVFSPDGKTVAFFSDRSGHQDIWIVPADASSKPRRLTQEALPADDSRFSPSWSPDGRFIAYVSAKSNYWHDDVWLVETATGKERQLTSRIMANATPTWAPDGKRLALLGTWKTDYWYEDLADIFVVDVESGREEAVEMQIWATDRLNRFTTYWSGDGSQLFFLYQERGNVNLWSVPSSGGVATRLTHWEGTLQDYDFSPAAGRFACVRSTPTRAGEVELVSTAGGRSRRLTQMAPSWRGVHTPREISFRSFDGLYIQGFLYLPPDFDASKRYPALVQVHGGGTNSYMNGLNLTEQFLASQGYVVLAINYRGGSGFGRRFQDLSINDWANGQARDAGAAADFLRSQPFSSGQVGIYGYSYGGIMTMAAITRVPDKFDAAVPMAGIYDFADAYRTADRVGKIFVKTGHGGSPEERPEIYAVSNSLARIDKIRTPLLIMHGEEDVRAPFRQFKLAVVLLEKHGKNFQSKTYPGEPHGFRNPQNRIDMYSRLLAFLNRHLKTG